MYTNFSTRRKGSSPLKYSSLCNPPYHADGSKWNKSSPTRSMRIQTCLEAHLLLVLHQSSHFRHQQVLEIISSATRATLCIISAITSFVRTTPHSMQITIKEDLQVQESSGAKGKSTPSPSIPSNQQFQIKDQTMVKGHLALSRASTIAQSLP